MVSSHGGLKTDQTCLIKTSLPGSDQGVVYFGCWLVGILCLDETSLITYLRNQIKQRRRRVLDHRASCVRGGCYLVQVPVCVWGVQLRSVVGCSSGNWTGLFIPHHRHYHTLIRLLDTGVCVSLCLQDCQTVGSSLSSSSSLYVVGSGSDIFMIIISTIKYSYLLHHHHHVCEAWWWEVELGSSKQDGRTQGVKPTSDQCSIVKMAACQSQHKPLKSEKLTTTYKSNLQTHPSSLYTMTISPNRSTPCLVEQRSILSILSHFEPFLSEALIGMRKSEGKGTSEAGYSLSPLFLPK